MMHRDAILQVTFHYQEYHLRKDGKPLKII